eukprot:746919-Hanusia_phi.AAC.5
MVSAAFRWLRHHSKLQVEALMTCWGGAGEELGLTCCPLPRQDGDAIIIGASSEQQLDSNLKALEDPNPLPPPVS